MFQIHPNQQHVKTIAKDHTVTKFVTRIKYALVRVDGLAMIEYTAVVALVAVISLGAIRIRGTEADTRFNLVNVENTKIKTPKVASNLDPETSRAETTVR